MGWVRQLRMLAPAVGFVLLVALVLLVLAAGGGRRAPAASTARSTADGPNGTVFIESNSSKLDANEIIAFRYRNGVLSGDGIRTYPMHGSGSHDLSNSGVLDSDQEVITNPQRTLLFAVNGSSDSIAIFHIRPGGALVPVKGSPFPSNGKAPASVGLARDTLIVANKAEDGVRNLTADPANYTSFRVRRDGTLSRPISSINVPPGSSPLQAYITPDHKVLISSEETGVFRAFRISPGGKLTQGPNSPLRLPLSIYAHHQRIAAWPAGLVSHPTLKILYAQVANTSSIVVYRWNDQARLTFVRAMHNPHSFLPCWTEVNEAGSRLYSGNAGSDNMSVFNVARNPLDPTEIQSVRLNAPGNPWNFQLDPTGRVIFLLDMRAVSQIPAGEGNQIHTLRILPNGKLNEEPSSPLKIPVPIGTNPIGLAVVPAR
ncbi:MAG: lactonase family protein [Solirubrobacteraceae bacterium]